MGDATLPKGWAHTQLGSLIEFNPKTSETDGTEAGFVPMALAPTGYGEKVEFEARPWGKIKKGYTHFSNGDVIFAKITPCFENGKAAIVSGLPNGVGAGSTEYYVLRPYTKFINTQFVYSVIKSSDFLHNGEMQMTGAVGHRRVPKDFVLSYPVALPPLKEQIRIANKLDELLAQVDTIKARVDAIPGILKRFRQSVLAAAVSGRLTEEWRGINPTVAIDLQEIQGFWAGQYEQDGKEYKLPKLHLLEDDSDELPENWIQTWLGHVFDVYVGATPSRKKLSYWCGVIPWVSSSEVAFCHISDTKEKITDDGLANTSTSIHPEGTVMLAMIGQGKTRGQPAILDIPACHNQNTAALRVSQSYCCTEFLYYYLWERYEKTREVGGGNNQKALNKSSVQGLQFPLPPLEEQNEIVRKVDSLFAFVDQIERQVGSCKAQIDSLTQSILAKAFRGELVPQNPDDEPASILLDRIQAERDAARKLVKQVKKKQKSRSTRRAMI